MVDALKGWTCYNFYMGGCIFFIMGINIGYNNIMGYML